MINKILNLFEEKRKIKVQEIFPSIYLLDFDSRTAMASTLMRIQERYEHPFFKNKNFTIKEFVEFSLKKEKRFNYFKIFIGFNFPSRALLPFVNKRMGKLTASEEEVLSLLPDPRKKKFYVISADFVKDRDGVLKHEIAHALYNLNKEYRNSVNDILSGVDKTDFFKFLSMVGYHKSTFLDEMQAYLLSDSGVLKSYGLNKKTYSREISKLQSLYKKTLNKLEKTIQNTP